MFYTYLWLREDGTPYYVGKAKGKRGFQSKSHRHNCPPKERVIVQYWDSEEEAFDAEKFLILYYGRVDQGTGCLRNLTEGGEGTSGCPHVWTEEAKVKLSESRKGMIFSEEHKKNLSEAHKGIIYARNRMPENERLRRKKESKKRYAEKPDSKAKQRAYAEVHKEEIKKYQKKWYRDSEKR